MLPWNADDLTMDETRFNGKARLFPLPDLVMFPHVMQPLHIYESRYRDLLNEALDSDGLIAMSVLDSGWERDYEGRPSVLTHACLGKIVTHHRQENGQYNLLLLGMRRVRIEQELPPLKSFREAHVELLDDYCLGENDADREALQLALTKRFQDSLPVGQSANPAVAKLLSAEVPLGVLTDLVSFALPLSFATKCELLRESDVDRRAVTLLDAIDGLPQRHDDSSTPMTVHYPPPFSSN